MASESDICNLALAHLGSKPTVVSISPPEGGADASSAARFYPVARDVLLEMHAWRFATRRQDLALLSDTPPPGWAYTYALPACIRPVAVYPPGGRDDDPQDFLVETRADGAQVIYSNAAEATLKFVAQVSDSAKFSPLFTNALAWLLASYLSGPITKNSKVKEACYKMFMVEMAKATSSDANARQANPYTTQVPAAIAARA